jgi:hypothetical protein
MLESEGEIGNTRAKIEELQNMIRQFPMKSFYTEDTNKRKRLNSEITDRGASGRAGGGGAPEYAELGAHGYEVEPQVIVDDKGGVFEPLFKVRQPLFTYAPR